MVKKKSILCKQGYLLKKKYCDNQLLEDLRNELTVTPYIAGDFGKKPQKFKVYKENEDYLALPKYYGLNKLGEPDKNLELLGEKTNIELNGTLRDYQMVIMEQIMQKIKKDGGGLLSLGCGQGKTVMALYVASLLKVKTFVALLVNIKESELCT